MGEFRLQRPPHPPTHPPSPLHPPTRRFNTLRVMTRAVFTPQGLHREHRRTHPRLQTCVSAGDVVSDGDHKVWTRLWAALCVSLPPAGEAIYTPFSVAHNCSSLQNPNDILSSTCLCTILNTGRPCRCCTRSANCHVGITIFLGAYRSLGWATTRAASPPTRAASTSGTQ